MTRTSIQLWRPEICHSIRVTNSGECFGRSVGSSSDFSCLQERAGISAENILFTRNFWTYQDASERNLVEAGGIEPPSESPE